MWLAQAQIFVTRPLLPWGGAKRSNINKFQLQYQFQRYVKQILCVSHKFRVKTYHKRFSFSRLGHAPDMRLRSTGVGMVPGHGVDFFH